MTLTEILSGLLITALWTFGASLNKESVLKGCSPSDISFSNSVWMLLGSIMIAVMTWQQEFLPFFAKGEEALLPLAISACKGFSIYVLVKSIAQISRYSLSSGVFALTSGLPIGSMAAVLLRGEQLDFFDYAAVVVIGFLSFLFFMRGHASHLNREDKMAYLLLVAAVTFNMVSDKIMAVNNSWAVHLAVSNFSWLLIGFVPRIWRKLSLTKRELRKIKNKPLTYRPLMIQGAVYLVTDVIFLYSAQHIFHGVVKPFIFLRLATPIIMMIGCLRYGEGEWREQLVFGISVVIPVILAICF